jgi:arsenate reductase-like glutaredoxin family protein
LVAPDLTISCNRLVSIRLTAGVQCLSCRASLFIGNRPERPAATPEVFINGNPPSREFLERHIDEERFLDFVSTRSPVFKQRPLPKSKKEAIDLMMQQPNLIKRPVLVRGSKVIFGFDREAYETLTD